MTGKTAFHQLMLPLLLVNFLLIIAFLFLSLTQLVQQQALVAQSAYLSPVATVAAVQMQQMAALNANGLIATPITPITPSSGNGQFSVPSLSLPRPRLCVTLSKRLMCSSVSLV